MEVPSNLYTKLGPRPSSSLPAKSSLSKSTPFAQVYLHSLIPNPSVCSKVYSEKVKDATLLLENIPESFQSVAQQKRTLKSIAKSSLASKKKKFKRWNLKQKKKAGIYLIPKESRKFDFFLPLHQLWLEYIKDLKGSLSPELFLEKLVKADFHGALLTVTRTLNPSLLGHTGILARETSTTFHCITRENKMVAIPKQGSVFTVAFDGSLYTLYGNTLRYRSAERSARKFKPKPTIDL